MTERAQKAKTNPNGKNEAKTQRAKNDEQHTARCLFWCPKTHAVPIGLLLELDEENRCYDTSLFGEDVAPPRRVRKDSFVGAYAERDTLSG